MSADDDSSLQDSVDKTLDEAQSGAPAVGATARDRFSANEIFQRIVASAEAEIEETHGQLFFSGVAAGFAITLTVFGYTVGTAAASEAGGLAPFLGPILYPLGFVIIVIGHYQLFTENTLPPVTLVLTRLSSLPALLRVWVLVVVGNFVGVGIGAFFLAKTGVYSPAEAAIAEGFARHALETPWWTVFFKSVVAGWLVAGVVWIDHAAHDTVARVVLVYALLYVIPLADLFHVITSMGEGLYLLFRGGVGPWPVLWDYVVPVLVGNTVGGVVPVAVLNFAHTGEHIAHSDTDAQDELTLGELFLGGLVGRSHIPFDDES